MYREALAAGYVLVLALIAVIDLRERRAPNVITYPTIALGLTASLLLGADRWEAILGGVLGFVAMLGTAVLGYVWKRQEQTGMGDVKTAAIAGLAVGAHHVFWMLAYTFIASAVMAAVVLATRRASRTDFFAFTPYLLLGVLLTMLLRPVYLLD
jgi:prepilin signal peptidase PulO-like enzyme (type II secretory pathway)